MSEPATEPTTPAPPTAPDKPANGEPITLPDDHPLVKAYEAQKERIRTLSATSQANADAATKLAEIEEANETEAQKQADALAAAQAKVKEYETREQIAAWAKEVSEETGVPAEVLSGSTKEELEAHAAKLKPLLGQQADPAKPGAVPTIGKTPQSPTNISLRDQVAAAEAARDQTASGSPEWKAAQTRVMELKGMQLFEASQTT